MSGRSRRIVVRPLDPPLLSAQLGTTKAFVSATLTIGRRSRPLQGETRTRKAKELIVDSPLITCINETYLQTIYPPLTRGSSLRRFGKSEGVGTSREVARLCSVRHYMVQRVASYLEEETHLLLYDRGVLQDRVAERLSLTWYAVLVATRLWQGVDVPGDALRLVIIDKIPFSSPDDPILSARMEWVESKGQSSFGTFQLPQAALLLRQGVGRLIRRRTDWGMVAILDQRVITKGYGRVLLNSLPRCPTTSDFSKVINHFGVRFDESQ